MSWFARLPLFAVALLPLGTSVVPAHGQSFTVTAGSNMFVDFNEEIEVGYSGFAGQYFLQADLVHDPNAGPMIKRFQSPIDDTGQPILLDAEQPAPQVVSEEFLIVPPGPAGPTVSEAVHDWHEEILTPGWEWVLPGDARFPTLFPRDQSLITRDGAPHPWKFTPMPAVHQPHKLWVQFPAIRPGEVLDIHKALLWVGTPGNTVWGDDALDDRTIFPEDEIRVWEYPTPVPEPAAGWLLAIGSAIVLVVIGRQP